MDIALLRSSFEKLAPNAQAITTRFYRNLFERYPEVRPLFRTGDMQDQQLKLIRALTVIVRSADDLEILSGFLMRLGRSHAELGVQSGHYPMVGQTMLDTLAEMAGIATELAGLHPAGFNAAQFRDRLDNGRKVAIQILEFLDRHGVTIRRGDLRRINRRRLDLFGPPPGLSDGGETSPVGRPDFKSGRGRQTVSGGFDSHSPPPVPPDHRASSRTR